MWRIIIGPIILALGIWTFLDERSPVLWGGGMIVGGIWTVYAICTFIVAARNAGRDARTFQEHFENVHDFFQHDLESPNPSPPSRGKAAALFWIGFGMNVIGFVLYHTGAADLGGLVGVVMILAGMILGIMGSREFAKVKGYDVTLGYSVMFFWIGAIVLLLLPDKGAKELLSVSRGPERR